MAPPDPRSPPPADCRGAAVRELIGGREVAARLGDLLRRRSAGEGGRPDEAGEMAEQVLTSLSQALQALEYYSGEFSEVCQGLPAAPTSLCSDEGRSVASSSGKRKARQPADRRGGQRRRSNSSGQLTVRSKTTDDGHTWRKYGQKGIQSSAHPRSYFRCTHKHDQGCQAIRQVQKCEEDPSVFVITYMGQHTCTKSAKQPGGGAAGESYLISFGAAGPAIAGGGGGSTAREVLQVPAGAFDVDLQPGPRQDHEFPVDDDALSNLSRNDSSSEFLMLPELQEALDKPAVLLLPAASDMIGDATSGMQHSSSCVSPSSCLAVDSFPFEGLLNLDDHDELDHFMINFTAADCDR